MFTSLKTIPQRIACAALLGTLLLTGQLHAATFKVTRSDDRNITTNGCPSSASSDCSLREALTLANTNAGADTIDIVVPSTNTITLAIAESLVVGGSGLVINGNGVTIQRSTSAANFAIFVVSAPTAVFNNMTIANGVEAAGRSGGGAIFVSTGTNLSINNSTLRNNSAQNGGAIYVDGNTAAAPTQLTLTNCSVLNNESIASGSAFNGGGGVYVEPNAKLTLLTTTLSGNTTVASGGALHIGGILSASNAEISGNTASGAGGGVLLEATAAATLVNSLVSNNTAVISGGGVYASGGTLNISGGSFLNNRANDSGAGGLNSFATSVINSVTFAGNNGSRGGAIGNFGTMTLSNSLLRGNVAFAGGGIAQSGNGNSLSVSNTTITGNSVCDISDCLGGAIDNNVASLTLLNATITNNQGFGGGVTSNGVFGNSVLKVRNTIIAGNRATGAGVSPNVSGVFDSGGNNLIGNGAGSVGFSAARNDKIGTAAAPLDAKLRPLGNYGGATLTQPPFYDSPAVNAGNNCVVVANLCGDGNPALSTDQRGVTRIGSVTGFVSDIGAVELQTAVVTNISDALPASAAPFNSLRSFVEGAYPYDLITFSPSAFPSPNTSINLVAPLTVNRPLEIVGFNANSPKISGLGQTGAGSFVVRIFSVGIAGDLALSNINLFFGGGRPAASAGAGSGNGGIIENFGRLSLSNCQLSFSETPANGSGGALFNDTGASAEIDRCSFTVNKAAVGGAIFNLGKLKVSRSTFAFNNATVGAAISSTDSGPNSSVLTSVTITNNTATASGGGVRYMRTPSGSNLTLQNSIVAENIAPTAPDIVGDYSSLGNNLIGRADGGTGFVNGTNADIVGSLAAPVTANLIGSSNAVNNGGQIFTLRPLPASRAINNGVALGFSTDQRGFPRAVGGAADIGAIEFNMTPIAALEGTRRRLPNGGAGAAYTQTIEAFGASAFTFSSSGLPAFLTLTPSTTALSTATLTGTPTLAQVGTYTFSITATAPALDAFTVSNDYTLVVGATLATLNIDNSDATTIYYAATDGVLLIRYLLGFRGAALIANARGTGTALRTATEIESHIATNLALFDVDGDGQTLAMTDGL